jgi:hypothetical protein
MSTALRCVQFQASASSSMFLCLLLVPRSVARRLYRLKPRECEAIRNMA